VSERRRHAFRLGRVAIPNETVSCRCRWLCLPRGRLRQRFRRSGRLLPVARGWRGPAARFHYSPDHHDTGVPQSQKLLGICQPEPARRMERLGHVRNLASGTDAERLAKANEHEITKPPCAPAAPEASGADRPRRKARSTRSRNLASIRISRSRDQSSTALVAGLPWRALAGKIRLTATVSLVAVARHGHATRERDSAA